MNLFLYFIALAYILILLLVCSSIFFKYIYAPYRRGTSNGDFNSLLVVLNVIIQSEIEIYEKNIFNKKGALTPQNFENYYNDITHHIIDSLSSQFFKKITEYITKDAVVTYICRHVKDYLAEKVNGSI